MKNLLLLLLSIAMLSSCASADKLLEQGDYDGLVRLADQRLLRLAFCPPDCWLIDGVYF